MMYFQASEKQQWRVGDSSWWLRGRLAAVQCRCRLPFLWLFRESTTCRWSSCCIHRQHQQPLLTVGTHIAGSSRYRSVSCQCQQLHFSYPAVYTQRIYHSIIVEQRHVAMFRNRKQRIAAVATYGTYSCASHNTLNLMYPSILLILLFLFLTVLAHRARSRFFCLRTI